jgi:mono/diheme cytochrome c family protein
MKSVYLAASLIALASVAKAETIVKRGEYLVTTIGGCGNCHTPRQGGTIEGKVIPGTELSGGLQLDEDVGHLSMPNITPDIKTGIASGLTTRSSWDCAMADARVARLLARQCRSQCIAICRTMTLRLLRPTCLH